VTDAELQAGGRSNSSYSDTKYISQEGEWFLAGVLDGIADGELDLPSFDPVIYSS
jgi:glutamine synthetase